MDQYNVYFDGKLVKPCVPLSKANYWVKKWAVTMPLANVTVERVPTLHEACFAHAIASGPRRPFDY